MAHVSPGPVLLTTKPSSDKVLRRNTKPSFHLPVVSWARGGWLYASLLDRNTAQAICALLKLLVARLNSEKK